MPDDRPIDLGTGPDERPQIRNISTRLRLSDTGLVAFRKVCRRIGILDEETDTIRPVPQNKAPSE